MIDLTPKVVDPRAILIPAFEIDKEEIKILARSIEAVGLQNKPIIKPSLEIVAGKKRVLACIFLEWDEIPVQIVPEDTSPLDCELISIDENLCRNNMPWYDQVVMQKRRHDIRQLEHGASIKGRKTDGWSLRDTAAELNISLGSLSENLRLADAILQNPSFKKIQDKMTARRIILTELKRSSAEQQTALPVSIITNKVYHGSSEEILKYFPDKIFDCCITDPPWLEYTDKKLVKDEFTFDVFKMLYSKMKDNSFLYMFVSTTDFYIYRTQLEQLGFQTQKYPLIWIKEGSLSLGNTSWQYQRSYEPILLAVKGSPALTRDMLPSTYSTKVVPSAKMIHPNEKPKEIIKLLIEHSTYDGSVVVDPFGGSGVVAASCKETGRNYITIERDANYYTGIVDRLRDKINENNN